MVNKKSEVKIRATSSFKDEGQARQFFKEWVNWLGELNGTNYERIEVDSALGKTVVWAINSERTDFPVIVIFPGFRTCSLFWDLDNALAPLKKSFRIFLVDINGQPCLSEGKVPDIKGDGYGVWAADLLGKLSINQATIAGASFGALVSLKLCAAAPHLVSKAILLNPGCLQPFSLTWKNIYNNFLPIVFPTRKNIERFLTKAIFNQPHHSLSPSGWRLLVDYELFVLNWFRNRAQTPYPMKAGELRELHTETHLVLGEKDLLFPYRKSVRVATRNIRTLHSITILPGIGHGIETSRKAIEIVTGIALGEPICQSERVTGLEASSNLSNGADGAN